MRTVMVIDGADNCACDCFLASDGLFARIFPGDGQDVEFWEDLRDRTPEGELDAEFAAMRRRRVPKRDVRGIDGLLFELRDRKKRFYPNKRESGLDGWGRAALGGGKTREVGGAMCSTLKPIADRTNLAWSTPGAPPVKTVNMHEAKTHLSRLVEAAAKGEPFVIARAGKPLVKVVALEQEPQRKPQRIGFLKGRFTYDPEVDRQIDEEIRREFEESIARGLFPEGYDENGNPIDDDARRRA